MWLLCDPTAFATPIARALAGLACLQRSEGGVVYEPGSRDVNCWVSLFTDQARHWALHGAAPLAML